MTGDEGLNGDELDLKLVPEGWSGLLSSLSGDVDEGDDVLYEAS